MSVKEKKVLHIDRNDHYGGWVLCAVRESYGHLRKISEAASVNIEAVTMTC